MKIRVGFVSNSSSSSFVCSLDNKYTIEQTEFILEKLIEMYNEIFSLYDDNFCPIRFDEIFGEIRFLTKDDLNRFKDFNIDIEYLETVVGKTLLIEGFGDNSIPSSLFDMIEDKFNATRLHLG